MSFTPAVTQTIEGMGPKIMVYGTYTNTSGSTGGDILTYLNVVEQFFIQPAGSAVSASAPVINETLPLTNTAGTVTIVTVADEDGYWQAWGY